MLVKQGESVKVGQTIIKVDEGGKTEAKTRIEGRGKELKQKSENKARSKRFINEKRS